MRTILTFLIFINATLCYASEVDIEAMRNNHFSDLYAYACELEPEYLISPEKSENEAAKNEILLAKGFTSRFSANKDETYFFQLAITNWDQKFIIMVDKDVKVDVIDSDKIDENINNYYCVNQKRKIYHFNTHEWASYLVTIVSPTDKNVWITILPESDYR